MSDPTTPDRRPTSEAPSTNPTRAANSAESAANRSEAQSSSPKSTKTTTGTAPTSRESTGGAAEAAGSPVGKAGAAGGRAGDGRATGEAAATGSTSAGAAKAGSENPADASAAAGRAGDGGKAGEAAAAGSTAAGAAKTGSTAKTADADTAAVSGAAGVSGTAREGAAKAGSTEKTADAGAAAVSGAAEGGDGGRTGAGDDGGKKVATDDTVEIGKVDGGEKPAEAGPQAGAGAKATEGKTKADKKPWRLRIKRGPWLTVGGIVVVLAVLATLGFVWGLGPMNRLNAERGITPPAKLGGLDRITDQDTRDQLQLNQTRERLSQINDGKQVTVEAYGSIEGDRLYMLIALRGKVDIDKTVADSGATPDQIKKVGQATCVETGNLPTQCYRGSNTLTVIAQTANEDVTVDAVGPVAEEAFNAMK
ncbi:hypothetical protein EV652_101783 [Kribbella steppae]|uniref:Uncharacterized protein n=1 Tax=Kribbella steppae TaxID=2512223 RepID=A0A4R2HX52_9ACTN|nr:hypothetical protein [Kribbella steppae]TCO35897.1 hypothetical protein EV652_101783 [Kribbella steppae]